MYTVEKYKSIQLKNNYNYYLNQRFLRYYILSSYGRKLAKSLYLERLIEVLLIISETKTSKSWADFRK